MDINIFKVPIKQITNELNLTSENYVRNEMWQYEVLQLPLVMRNEARKCINALETNYNLLAYIEVVNFLKREMQLSPLDASLRDPASHVGDGAHVITAGLRNPDLPQIMTQDEIRRLRLKSVLSTS